MKYIDWNDEKNEELKKERGVSFEVVTSLIENQNFLDVIIHPNQMKYPNQRMFIIEIDNYVYLVPFVEEEDKIFLKTKIPNRKATKKYLR